MNLNKLFIVVTIVFVLLLASCSSDKTTSNPASDKKALENLTNSGLPIVKNKLKLNIFAGRPPESAKNWNDVLIWNTYKKMTNIDVNWNLVEADSLDEKRNLALSSGSLPDAFYSAGIPTVDLMKYGEQGLFIPLNKLIEKYAPNLTKLFKKYPEVKKAITFPDGNIYSFPTIVEPEFSSMRLGPRPWINEKWLDALKMKSPETTEEYYEFLKAVKEKDPNGNNKADEIPFGSYSIGMLLRWLNGSYGLQNRGFNHPYVDMEPAGDGLRFIPTSDEYKEMLEYVHKLYSEGLIEKNIFSLKSDQFLAKASEGQYGSTVSHSPQELFGVKDYTAASALEGPHGDKLITGITPVVTGIDGLVVTNENKNPAATVRWMDYFYSDEGAKLLFMGVKGKTFEETKDGELQYLDKITNSKDDLTFEQELAKYLTWPGGGFAGIVKEAYFKGLENAPDSRKSAKQLEPNIIKEVWPSFTYTKEENSIRTTTGTDIEKYVGEMRDKFISGDEPFSKWDNYIKTIEKMGLEKYMEVENAALKRYKD